MTESDPRSSHVELDALRQRVAELEARLADQARTETELEAELRQAKKMESFGRVAGGVAHDFNNLLSPIFGYTELLLLTATLTDKQRQQLREILAAAERARDLTQQLLAFSRKQVLEMHPVDLSEVVGAFRKILRRTIREDIEMVFLLAPQPSIIRADTAQIEQVLMNLAVNAQDAMPDGGQLVIEISDATLDADDTLTRPSLEPGPYVALRVSDTGAGMGEETLEHAFEPFFTTKERGRGTGLGLSTVHGIINQHSGDIRAESWPGRGTTFQVLFPRVDETAERRPLSPMPHADAVRGRETILVVEDDEKVRRLVCRILEDTGYEVFEASNGLEGLHRAARRSDGIDLLVTDVVMPGLSGPELYDQLQRTLPGLKVLYMSGYAGDVIVRRKALGEGIHFLPKPITVRKLREKVRDVLDAHPQVDDSNSPDSVA